MSTVLHFYLILFARTVTLMYGCTDIHTSCYLSRMTDAILSRHGPMFVACADFRRACDACVHFQAENEGAYGGSNCRGRLSRVPSLMLRCRLQANLTLCHVGVLRATNSIVAFCLAKHTTDGWLLVQLGQRTEAGFAWHKLSKVRTGVFSPKYTP